MCNFALVYMYFMRKVLVIFALFSLLFMLFVPTGCNDRKPRTVDSTASDTAVRDTSAADSAENLIEATPMPKAADELFDDFVFNFAANRKLQRRRIVFPLPVYRDGKVVKKIAENKWEMERFFMRQEYYTLIFDNARQMNLVKDTTISHVVIEKIFSHKNLIQQYLFNKIKGKWMLTSMNYMSLAQNKNADFLKFYNKFATDTAFQVRSMAREVQFSAPDPNDDFAQISGVMMPQQWPDFKPGLIPNGTLYNIIYGQKYTDAGRRLFVIRGIANGLEIELSFRKVGGQWKLVKFNS
jgi:lipoprotein